MTVAARRENATSGTVTVEPLFVRFDDAAAALLVSRRTLASLFELCPRDPATKALLRGMSRLGLWRRFTPESVREAGRLLAGRDFPVTAARRGRPA